MSDKGDLYQRAKDLLDFVALVENTQGHREETVVEALLRSLT
jgi:hypothetical protein